VNRAVVTCRSLDQIDFVPTVIVGFYQSEKKKIFSHHCAELQARFPQAEIFGCSSTSNLYDDSPHVDTDGSHLCVFSCMDMDPQAYTLQRISTELPGELEIDTKKRYRAIILSSSYFDGMETHLKTLQHTLGTHSLYGGIAGAASDSKSASGDVYYRGAYWQESMLVWLIDQKKYRLSGIATHYFQPVGFEMEITAARGNTIHEIENRPALEVAEEIIGTLSPESIASFEHPFFLKQEDGIRFSEAPLCSVRGVNREQKSIDVYRNVAVHDTLKVGISLDRKAQKSQLNVFKRYKKSQAVAFVFNCVGIKENLGTMETLYLMHLKQSLRIPFVGFHTFGEIGPTHTHSSSVLHNQTIALAVLSERGV